LATNQPNWLFGGGKNKKMQKMGVSSVHSIFIATPHLPSNPGGPDRAIGRDHLVQI
jgi:hypothetical protein